MRCPPQKADGLHEPQPLLETEAAMLAIVVDRLAVDVLHDEVRPAVRATAAVQQAGKVRMIEASQDLAFLQESAHDGARIHAAADDLERHLLGEGGLGALGEIDLAHTAAPQEADDAPGAHGGAGLQLRLGSVPVHLGIEEHERWLIEDTGGSGVGGQQQVEPRGERRILAAQLGQKARPLGLRQLDQPVEEILPVRRLARRCDRIAAGFDAHRRAPGKRGVTPTRRAGRLAPCASRASAYGR